MNKLLHIIFVLTTATALHAQSFATIEETFAYAVKYHYSVQPFPEPKRPFYLGLEREHYVAITLPDSCSIEKTFPKDSFPNYHFCGEKEKPLRLRCRAQQIIGVWRVRNPSKVPRLCVVQYSKDNNRLTIQINDTAFVRYKGRIENTLSDWTIYTFIYDETLQMWVVENIRPGGP